MVSQIKQRHALLLKRLNAQSAYIDQKVDEWKFSHPELALYIETKKRTIERTLSAVAQALEAPETTEDLQSLTRKLDDVEAVFTSLQQDFKPRWRKAFETSILVFLSLFLTYSAIFNIHCVTSSDSEPTLLRGDRVLVNKVAFLYSDLKRNDLVIFDSPEIPYESSWGVKYLWQRFVGVRFEPLDLPEGPEQIIRRVVAVPGDTIEGKIEQGHPVIYLNGDKLTEPYVNTYPLIASLHKPGTVEATHPAARYLPASFVKNTAQGPVSWSTHDPGIPYDQQPFYKLNKNDVLTHPATGKPMLKHPNVPQHNDVFGPIEIPEGKYWCMGDNRRNSNDSRTWGLVDAALIRGRAHVILYSIDTQESTWVLDVIKDPVRFCSQKLRTDRFFKKLVVQH